jgi:hypothetical protein
LSVITGQGLGYWPAATMTGPNGQTRQMKMHGRQGLLLLVIIIWPPTGLSL